MSRLVSFSVMLLSLWGGTAAAQPLTAPAPVPPKMTFEEAVQRAIANNPSVAQAAANILRAQGILTQVGSFSLPSLAATVTSRSIGPVPEFQGNTITPRTQLNAGVAFAAPLIVPALWAERAQARDQVGVAEINAQEVRRQIADATAQAYLAIIAARQLADLNVAARDNARAHFDYAQQRYQGGMGSRLNALRAEQEASSDEVRVETAQLAVRRTQEALGVLVASDGPVDTADEPAFEVPADIPPNAIAPTTTEWLSQRADIRLVRAQTSAAQRVVSDSVKDWFPTLTGVFAPQTVHPGSFFTPSNSWALSFVVAAPIFDGGQRRGIKRQREASLNTFQAAQNEAERQARSDVRAALDAVRTSERALVSAQAAVAQAQEVLKITDIAFRAGATTNIELIDAQRVARDVETDEAIAAHALRRAKLELLVALGRFPK